MTPLILASQSPRRAELLTQMGLPYEVHVADIDESRLSDESPSAYVERLACEKCVRGIELAKSASAAAGAEFSAAIGADTIVLLDDEILGKPRGLTEGTAMLRRLSGRTHEVLSGVAAGDGVRLESTVVSSRVTFRSLDEAEIAAYWATGEGADKAGSYGIQGIGGILVERLEGSFSAVMGLPVQETEALLQSLDVDTWSLRSSYKLYG